MNHSWKELNDGSGFDRCIKCGCFRKQKANVLYSGFKPKNSFDKWVNLYATKKNPKWSLVNPDCVVVTKSISK